MMNWQRKQNSKSGTQKQSNKMTFLFVCFIFLAATWIICYQRRRMLLKIDQGRLQIHFKRMLLLFSCPRLLSPEIGNFGKYEYTVHLDLRADVILIYGNVCFHQCCKIMSSRALFLCLLHILTNRFIRIILK